MDGASSIAREKSAIQEGTTEESHINEGNDHVSGPQAEAKEAPKAKGIQFLSPLIQHFRTFNPMLFVISSKYINPFLAAKRQSRSSLHYISCDVPGDSCCGLVRKSCILDLPNIVHNLCQHASGKIPPILVSKHRFRLSCCSNFDLGTLVRTTGKVPHSTTRKY